jgi:hypothetical protein
MKKCPPGVICIENVSLFFVIICVVLIGYLIYSNSSKSSEKIVIQQTNNREETNREGPMSFFPSLNIPYFNTDPLLNPYAPPLRDERYLVPINVSTNVGAVDTSYRQVGMLTPLHGKSKDNILPLMGRPLFTNRNKWQYYSTSNQHNNVKLPLMYNGRSCTNEYGCDQLNSGDSVYVEGANEAYKVTLYDNATIKYLPSI